MAAKKKLQFLTNGIQTDVKQKMAIFSVNYRLTFPRGVEIFRTLKDFFEIFLILPNARCGGELSFPPSAGSDGGQKATVTASRRLNVIKKQTCIKKKH